MNPARRDKSRPADLDAAIQPPLEAWSSMWRRFRSRRSAGSPQKSAFSGPLCVILRTGSPAGCAPNPGLAGP